MRIQSAAIRPVFVVMLPLLTVFYAGADSSTDLVAEFSANAGWRTVQADKRGTRVTVVDSGTSRGTVAEVSWKPGHHPYAILTPEQRRGIDLPHYRETLDGSLVFSVFTDTPEQVHHINLRLRDSKNDIFQWNKKVDLIPERWNRLVYELDDEGYNGSWGPANPDGLQPPVALQSIVIALKKEAGARAGWLRVDRIEHTGTSELVRVPTSVSPSGSVPALDAVAVSLATGPPLHILRPEDSRAVSLGLHNRSLETIRGRIEAAVDDYRGQRKHYSDSFVLDAGKRAALRLDGLSALRGTHFVEYTLTHHQEAGKKSGRAWFCIMTPAGPFETAPDTFTFGVCAHTGRFTPEAQQKIALAAGLAGATQVRTGFNWGFVQPKRGIWTWDRYDQLSELYGRYNMRMQVLLTGVPGWAATNDGDPDAHGYMPGRTPPENMDDWATFVTRAARRYGERVTYWETWNEANGEFFHGTPESMAQMQKAAYESVKKVSPAAVVTTPGWAHYDRHPDFIRHVIAEAKGSYDMLAWHRHGTFQIFYNEVTRNVLPLMEEYGLDMPLYFTESAVNSHGYAPGNLRAQAEILVKRVIFARANGAVAYNWYKMRDIPEHVRWNASTMGLLTWDFQPKPAYAAYNTLARHFSGKTFIRELAVGPNRFAYLFGDQDTYSIASWAETADAQQKRVVRSDADSVRHRDIMDNAIRKVPGDNRTVFLDITTEPSFLELENASQPPRIGPPLIGPESPLVVMPDRTAAVRLSVSNPFSATQTVSGALSVADRDTAPGSSVTVHPGETGTLSFPVPPAASSAARRTSAQEIGATLTYRFEPKGLSGDMTLSLSAATPVSSSLDTAPDFKLDSAADIINRYRHLPGYRHLQWQGPHDLSAAVRLGLIDRHLVVRVKARDDIHYQPFTGKDTWKGDNVQLAFQIPGQDGYWGANLARRDGGDSDHYVTRRPAGQESTEADWTLRTDRARRTTTYQLSIPLQSLGVDKAALKSGFRFNLIVNDNDGTEREGWARISPGIGQKKAPSLFPCVVFVE